MAENNASTIYKKKMSLVIVPLSKVASSCPYQKAEFVLY